MTNTYIFLVLALGGFMGGCSTKYQVNINGFLDMTRTQAIKANASIFMVQEETEDSNPIFASEVRHKIQRLLKSKGYAISDTESADYHLFFTYGMDSGQIVQSSRFVHEPDQIVTIQRSNNKGGQSYSTIHIPGKSYRVPYSETVFGHWLTLYLYDASNASNGSAPREPLWIGEISTSTPSSDLREMMNPLLVVAFEYFGQNTYKRVRETISRNDTRTEQLEGG